MSDTLTARTVPVDRPGQTDPSAVLGAQGDAALVELYRSRAEAVRKLLNLNSQYVHAREVKADYEQCLAGIDKAIERHLCAFA